MATEPRNAARREQIVDAARSLVERDGTSGLTMQAVGREVGMRAPSLYKHFPDKAAIEVAIAVGYLEDLAEAGRHTRTFAGMCRAYRQHALQNPALYRMTTDRPLPRDALPEGLEERAAAPWRRALPDPDRARAAWAFAHGMVMLEIAGRFPDDADLDAAWAAGVAAFGA